MILRVNQRYETRRGALVPRSRFHPEGANENGTPLAIIEIITNLGTCERFVKRVMTKTELRKELGIGQEKVDII